VTLTGRRSKLKKQVSPVVTVIVILVVVVIVALLWNFLGNPRPSSGGRGGGGMGLNIDMSKITPDKLETARKKAQEARAKLMEQVKASKGGGEKAGGE
jgi:hypothetical protein